MSRPSTRRVATASGLSIWGDQPENAEKRSARLSGGLTAFYGKLYLGSENGYVYAIDQKDGKLLWSRRVPGEVIAAPAADAGRVVVVTSSGKLLALDAEKGDILWNTGDDQPNLTLRGQSAPIMAAGGVIYGRADGRVGVVLLEKRYAGQCVACRLLVAPPSWSGWSMSMPSLWCLAMSSMPSLTTVSWSLVS